MIPSSRSFPILSLSLCLDAHINTCSTSQVATGASGGGEKNGGTGNGEREGKDELKRQEISTEHCTCSVVIRLHIACGNRYPGSCVSGEKKGEKREGKKRNMDDDTTHSISSDSSCDRAPALTQRRVRGWSCPWTRASDSRLRCRCCLCCFRFCFNRHNSAYWLKITKELFVQVCCSAQVHRIC